MLDSTNDHCFMLQWDNESKFSIMFKGLTVEPCKFSFRSQFYEIKVIAGQTSSSEISTLFK